MAVNATIDNMPEKDKDTTESRGSIVPKALWTSKQVKVNIRCRPILPSDTENLTSYNDTTHAERAVDVNEPEGQVIVALDKTFQFDVAFDGDAGQDAVYRSSVAPLVQHFVDDCINCSIMAYGQTGSGKTHTMMGGGDDTDSRGMIPRAIEDVFAGSNPTTDFISVSFFEIYNEKLYDLLAKDKMKVPLMLREENHRFQIPYLSMHDVSDVSSALQYLEKGNKTRTTASTGQNETSSRSHALFRIHLRRNFETDTRNQALLNLVDLAGSESVRKTEAAGERLNEGSNINKGLLALGNCIADICQR